MSIVSGNVYLKPQVEGFLAPAKVGQANLFDSTHTYTTGDIVRLADGSEVISLADGNTQDPNVSFVGGGGSKMAIAQQHQYNDHCRVNC